MVVHLMMQDGSLKGPILPLQTAEYDEELVHPDVVAERRAKRELTKANALFRV